MTTSEKIRLAIRDPRQIGRAFMQHTAKCWHNDELYLKLLFYFMMGKRLDLKHPKTFNEKLQWLKLYNRRPEYTTLVDKYAVKDYVAEKIGKEYIIPTLGVWDKPEQIEWDKLPNQFVLKTTHGGGNTGVVICKDKSTFNREQAIAKLNRSLQSDIYIGLREWPYKDVPKRIIAEEYICPKISPAPKDLPDYKFYCFNGEPMYCQVIRDRRTNETIDFYDMNWVHQEFVGLNPVARQGSTPVARPKHLQQMQAICRTLAKDKPFVRVDLYSVDEKTYFGELTLYPASGIGEFTPKEWSLRLGEMITLPAVKNLVGGYKCLIINGSVFCEPIDEIYVELRDYKFFCFDGKVRFFKVDFGRQSGEHRANYYSREGQLLDFGETAFPPMKDKHISMPTNLQEMICLAEQVADKACFLRVDLYNANGCIKFGELTFYPAGGMGLFAPPKWDEKIGDWLTLPAKHP